MFRMGSGEWLVILFVATLFLGPKQIQLLVKKWVEVMKTLKATTAQINEELDS